MSTRARIGIIQHINRHVRLNLIGFHPPNSHNAIGMIYRLYHASPRLSCLFHGSRY